MGHPDPFDVEALRLPDSSVGALHGQLPKRPPRHRQGEQFLKGPIPWPWLLPVLKMPGRSVHVALLLWKEVGYRNRRSIEFNLSRAAVVLGVDPTTAREALRTLELAGLVTVRVIPGRPLEVTINNAPNAAVP